MKRNIFPEIETDLCGKSPESTPGGIEIRMGGGGLKEIGRRKTKSEGIKVKI
jgi:hypothetical protein